MLPAGADTDFFCRMEFQEVLTFREKFWTCCVQIIEFLWKFIATKIFLSKFIHFISFHFISLLATNVKRIR